MADVIDEQSHKRLRIEETAPGETSKASQLSVAVSTKQTTAQAATSAAEENPLLVPREIERLAQTALTINPKHLQSLKQAGVLGYKRPADKRFLDALFYEIDTDSLRQRINSVLTYYLRWKFNELGTFPALSIETQIGTIVPLCVNACMMVLYSKLRTIHKQYGTYASRYTVPPGYSRDLELPLPFADAIQNFGVFESTNMLTNYIFVPVFPENVKYEGRSTEEWHAFKYESCVPILKECGIPMKNVDTRIKFGSPWWTYRVKKVLGTFDLECILPPLHYSDHSTILAAMFLFSDINGNPVQLIKHRDDEPNYGVRFREIMNGFQPAGGQSNIMFSCEQPVLKTSKKISNQKFQDLTGNDIFKSEAASESAEKPLSSAKLKEMTGSDIFADGKTASREYFGGVRKPPGGESSIALV